MLSDSRKCLRCLKPPSMDMIRARRAAALSIILLSACAHATKPRAPAPKPIVAEKPKLEDDGDTLTKIEREVEAPPPARQGECKEAKPTTARADKKPFIW